METRLLGDITTVEDLLRQGIVDLVAFCGTNLPAATDPWLHSTNLMENPSCARWRNGKKKTSSLTQPSIGFISFYIEIPSICWRIDIFQHLRLSVFFSKIQLSRNVDWQYTWNLLVKYGCVMEDFNVIVSKEFCALAAMLLPTVWGATPSEERCWKKFGKDLGGYCTIHKQCQPGINKPPKLGGGV